MDRAIILELRRKLPNESIDRLRYAEPELYSTLAAKLARFAEDQSETVRLARPYLPASLHDRAQDNWEPLLAIADIAGGEWPEIARNAAIKISGAESIQQSTGTELLADIQEIFETRAVDRISTESLISALLKDDEKPWATYNRGQRITPRQVARVLKGYGILSRSIRIGVETPKGYMLDQFKEAFSRYLETTSPESATTPQAS
jgi:putative DNA primase/helicase